MRKRAQIEIIGLFVIIILLTISLLIALRFLLRPQSTNILESGQSIKANSIMNSILSTNVDFSGNNNQKLKDKISDCIDNQNSDQSNCNGIEITLTTILNQFFKNKRYHLTIKESFGTGIIVIAPSPAQCNENTYPKTTVNDQVRPAPRITYTLIICNPNSQ